MEVFVELGFIGRLKKSSEIYQVEVYFFKEQLEQFGHYALNVPGYSVTAEAPNWGSKDLRLQVKVCGVWTEYVLRFPAVDKVVICDR